jgi:tetratricopeptide (TPR) repeat protein
MQDSQQNHAPADAHALIQQGYQALSDNDFIQAGSCFKQALEINQDQPDAWRGLGRACESAELYDDAMFAFQQCLEIDQRDAETLRRVAAVHIQKQQYDAAIDALETCVDVEPQQADTVQALDLLKQHVAQQQ